MPSSAPVALPEARAIARDLGAASRPAAERVPAADAVGRSVAEDLQAPDRLPRFDGSAMDGFAVRADDTSAASVARPVALRVLAESRAGHGSAVPVAAGTAVRISTGAPLPEGADAVVRVEDAEERGGTVQLVAPVPVGHDVRRAGEDVAEGERVLSAGEVVTPLSLGLLAGLGVETLRVLGRPRVLVVVTGDEVSAGDGAPTAHMVRDVGGVAIPALLRAAGARDVRVARVGDDLAATVAALRADATDLVLTTGGMSVGRHDHVRRALAEVGAREHVGRVAVRPGGPAWIGTAPAAGVHRPVVGLPGNPAAAMVITVLLALPVLAAMTGRPATAARHAVLRGDTRRDPRRHRVLWARLAHGADGTVHATPDPLQQAHRLRPAAAADALAIVPPGDGPLADGAVVEVVPLPGVAGP